RATAPHQGRAGHQPPLEGEMSTNNQVRARASRVADLPEVRRRRRLENLLHTRKRVAELEAEYRSHGLDEHLEYYLLQLQIEQVIDDEFPEVFAELIGEWVTHEITGEHPVGLASATCSLCHVIAAHHGDDSG